MLSWSMWANQNYKIFIYAIILKSNKGKGGGIKLKTANFHFPVFFFLKNLIISFKYKRFKITISSLHWIFTIVTLFETILSLYIWRACGGQVVFAFQQGDLDSNLIICQEGGFLVLVIWRKKVIPVHTTIAKCLKMKHHGLTQVLWVKLSKQNWFGLVWSFLFSVMPTPLWVI